jgi:dihydroorotate dehydrogenase
MYRIARVLLFLLPAEAAHRLGMGVLALLSHFPRLCGWLRHRMAPPRPQLAIQFAGLHFDHPVGLAAGLDKDGEALPGLFGLGFAAVEIGTVTPRPQPGNPRPRLFRLTQARALINRMGFNSQGVVRVAARLGRTSWRGGPVGVNLGKNKETPLERALDDYQAAARALAPHGDYVVINASSPNTPGLRTLQAPDQLKALLLGVRQVLDEVTPGKPLFLKIAPDLEPEAVDAVVDVAVECRVAGLIATNTTLTRPATGHPQASEEGGLSGAPLRERSTEVLQRAFQRAAGRLGLIGVGGVMTAEDLYEKIRAGASVVQVYTGFIYAGPAFVRSLLEGLAQLLHADGFTQVTQAVGAALRHSERSPASKTNLPRPGVP